MDKLFHRVRALVERGERLSSADCRALFDAHDLNEFSRLSRIARERRYGRDAFYRSVQLFHYHGEHPELFLSEIETTASGEAAELAIKPFTKEREGEGLEKWEERFRAIAAAATRPITLRLTPRFVAALAEAEGKKGGEILVSLRAILPIRLSADGAELFNDEWRAAFAPAGIGAERWLAVHQGAHEIRIKSDAAMTYHTGWDPDLYVSHLETIRALQEKTGGFHAFIPMAFHNTNPDARYLALPSASMTLKTTAISRLFLDNISHIVAAPGLSDPEISWVALSYGADTIDSTIRPSDLESLNDGDFLSSGGELFVLSEGDEKKEDALSLPMVEDRIVEARWRPIPVNGEFERIAIEEIER